MISYAMDLAGVAVFAVSGALAAALSMLLIAGLRLAAIQWRISLPVFSLPESRE